MNDKILMNKAADNIRILAASMVEKAKSGHPGGAMGGADFINVLYSEFLEYDPKNPYWEGRDRFFLDPGHMAPMLYAQLALAGKFTLDELAQLRQWGSPTPGHPEVDLARGIENTSGPLGQGHTFAVGAAIAAKFLKARLGDVMGQTIYAYISDGGIQEEISQGAGRIAGTLGLDNLIMFYDSNDIQLSTTCHEVTCEDVAKKYEAWNWKVITINGNDQDNRGLRLTGTGEIISVHVKVESQRITHTAVSRTLLPTRPLLYRIPHASYMRLAVLITTMPLSLASSTISGVGCLDRTNTTQRISIISAVRTTWVFIKPVSRTAWSFT